MEQYEQLAVNAMVARLSARLSAMLASIESADSVTLQRPEAILSDWRPHDTRSPLVQVWDLGCRPFEEQIQNYLATVKLAVAVTFNGSSDTADNAARMRRYARAVRLVWREDPSLGGTSTVNGDVTPHVADARWVDSSNDAHVIDHSATRVNWLAVFDVDVFAPPVGGI